MNICVYRVIYTYTYDVEKKGNNLNETTTSRDMRREETQVVKTLGK